VIEFGHGRAERVSMRINQARHCHPASQINQVGLRSGERLNLFVAAHLYNSAILHGHGLHDRKFLVHSQDSAVVQNQVGLLGGTGGQESRKSKHERPHRQRLPKL